MQNLAAFICASASEGSDRRISLTPNLIIVNKSRSEFVQSLTWIPSDNSLTRYLNYEDSIFVRLLCVFSICEKGKAVGSSCNLNDPAALISWSSDIQRKGRTKQSGQNYPLIISVALSTRQGFSYVNFFL